MTRTVWIALLSASAAAGAIVLLVAIAEPSGREFMDRMAAAGVATLAAASLASLVQIVISARKWMLVLASILEPDAPLPSMRVSCLISGYSALAAQVLPLIVAAPVLRSCAARYTSGVPIAYGATASVVEQAFDVAAIFVFLVPTLIVYLLALAGIDTGIAVWLALAALVAGVATASLRRGPERLLARAAGRIGGAGRPAQLLHSISRIEQNLQRRLLWLSLMRNGAILARVFLVAAFAGFVIPARELVYGHTIVQGSQIVSVTPGNLGVAEWSWAGVLGAYGHDLGMVALFALSLRVVSVASYILVAALITAYYALPWLWATHARPR